MDRQHTYCTLDAFWQVLWSFFAMTFQPGDGRKNPVFLFKIPPDFFFLRLANITVYVSNLKRIVFSVLE